MMDWPVVIAFGVGCGLGYLVAFGLGRRVAEDLMAERDDARQVAKAYLKRMRRGDVRRGDTIGEIEDAAGL